MSNIKMFKYDLIWEKTINSGQLNVNKMSLRSHENILVFYNLEVHVKKQNDNVS